MLSKKNKKDIIEKLNLIFNDYEKMSNLCNHLSNDLEKIINKISIIIKYAFSSPSFLGSELDLIGIICDAESIEEKYRKYLTKSKGLFVFLKKEEILENKFDMPLHSNIKLSDLKGLMLPTIDYLKTLCSKNLLKIKEQEAKKIFYQDKFGFEETGLVYKNFENVTIEPSSFIYYHPSLTGDISTDFKALYNDERYGGVRQSINPLNNSYISNIAKIKESKDISLRKKGDVYEIINGRHRIVYILNYGKRETIVAEVTKRIEDKEFNCILMELKRDYNIYAEKNNIFNDEPDVFLLYNSTIYEVKNKEKLKLFKECVKNKTVERNFVGMPFTGFQKYDSNIVYDYEIYIFKKYFELGDKIITGNFTDLLKICDNNVSCFLFHVAFRQVQYYCQIAQFLNQDFKIVYENLLANPPLPISREEFEKALGIKK